MKFAASLLGKTSEHCRLPLAPLMEGTRVKVRAATDRCGAAELTSAQHCQS